MLITNCLISFKGEIRTIFAFISIGNPILWFLWFGSVFKRICEDQGQTFLANVARGSDTAIVGVEIEVEIGRPWILGWERGADGAIYMIKVSVAYIFSHWFRGGAELGGHVRGW